MNTLGGIIKIESKLRKILPYNSTLPNDQSMIEYSNLLCEYISKSNNFSSSNINLVKIITDASDFTKRDNNTTTENYKDQVMNFKETLYTSTIEAIDQIKDDINQSNIKSYFLSYAAHIAKIIFKETNDINDAENWYSTAKKSASSSDMGLDRRHTMLTHNETINAAQTNFHLNRTRDLAKNWINASQKSIEISKKYFPDNSAYKQKDLGNALKSLYNITYDRKLARKAKKAYESFVEYHKNDPSNKHYEKLSKIKAEIQSLSKILNEDIKQKKDWNRKHRVRVQRKNRLKKPL